MQTINPNLATLILANQSFTQNVHNQPGVDSFVKNQNIVDENNPAFDFLSGMNEKLTNFNNISDNFMSAKNVLSCASDSLVQMLRQGESIRSLVEKAKADDCSEESLDAIQKEVNARIEAIQKIKDNTEMYGVNPFNTQFTLDIPKWQDYIGKPAKEGEEESQENAITNMLAEINVDMNIGISDNGKEFNLGGSATIKIGYADDGSLQITVDTAFDFDLSGLEEEGVQSENALDIINNFINLLTGKNNDLMGASNMFDKFMAMGTASILGDNFSIDAANGINIDKESSNVIKGQIVQHAAITLNSATANQCPSIAINLL